MHSREETGLELVVRLHRVSYSVLWALLPFSSSFRLTAGDMGTTGDGCSRAVHQCTLPKCSATDLQLAAWWHRLAAAVYHIIPARISRSLCQHFLLDYKKTVSVEACIYPPSFSSAQSWVCFSLDHPILRGGRRNSLSCAAPSLLFKLLVPRSPERRDIWSQHQIIWSGMKRNRIVQLEETSKDNEVQLPDYFRTNEELKHIIKNNIQIPLDHL